MINFTKYRGDIDYFGEYRFIGAGGNTVLIKDGYLSLSDGYVDSPAIQFSSGTGIYAPAQHNIAFTINSNEKIRINEDGYLGLGITDPVQRLSLDGAIAFLPVAEPDAYSGYGLIYVKETDGTLYFKSSAGQEFDLTVGGAGTGFIDGAGGAGQVTFWTSASNVGGDNGLYWDNVLKRLGVGTTTPTKTLDVRGSGIFAEEMNLSKSGQVKIAFKHTAITDNPEFRIGQIGTSLDSVPELHTSYLDDLTLERVIFKLDKSGLITSNRQTTGAHFETFIAGDINPLFRITSYPELKLEFRDAFYDMDPDVALQRIEEGTLGIVNLYGEPSVLITNVLTGGDGYLIIGSKSASPSDHNLGFGDVLVSQNIEIDGYLWADGGANISGKLFVSGNLEVDGYLIPARDDEYNLGSETNRWKDLYVGPGSIHIKSNSSQTETGVDRNWAIGLNSDGNLRITQGEDQLLVVEATGNIGIGLITPQELFHVAGKIIARDGIRLGNYPVQSNTTLLKDSGSQAAHVRLDDDSGYANLHARVLKVESGSTSAPGFSFISYPTTGLYAPASNTLGFLANGVERGRFHSSGGLSVNTQASPPGTSKFYVAGGGAILDGDTGIGTIAPNARLTVQGVLSLFETSSPSSIASYGKLYVASSDNDLHFLDSLGNDYNLTAAGGGVTAINGSSGRVSFFTSSSVIEGEDNLYWDFANDKLGIRTNTPISALDVRGDGYFDGYLMPFTDDVWALGTPDLRWREVYLGPGGIHLRSTSAQTDTEREWNVTLAGDGGFRIRQGNDEKLSIRPSGLLELTAGVVLGETDPLTATLGFGKLYVSNLDNDLHFISSLGFDTNLISAHTSSAQSYDGYIAFFTGQSAIAGDNDLFWDRANNRLGIHTILPNEVLTVSGVISLSEETVVPVNTSGFGKLYVSSVDNDLYFKDSLGNNYNLIPSVTPISATQGADGYIAFFTGANTIAGDNDLFWDRVNNRLGVGTIVPQNKLDVSGSIAIGTVYAGLAAAPIDGLIVEGDVGIGTSSPIYKLHVSENSSNVALFESVGSSIEPLVVLRRNNSIHNLNVGGQILFQYYNGSTTSQLAKIQVIKPNSIQNDTYKLIIGSNNGSGVQEQIILDEEGTIKLTPSLNTNFNLSSFDHGFLFKTTPVYPGGGYISSFSYIRMDPPDMQATSPITLTDLTTLRVTGAPFIAGNITYQNSYGIKVDSGTSRFDNQVVINRPSSTATLHVGGDGYFDGYLMPFTDDAYGLGTPQKRWRNIWAGPDGIHLVADTSQTLTSISRDWSVGVNYEGNFRVRQGSDEILTLNNTSLYINGENLASTIITNDEPLVIPIDYNDSTAIDIDSSHILTTQSEVDAYLAMNGATNFKNIELVWHALPKIITNDVTFVFAPGIHFPYSNPNGSSAFNLNNKTLLRGQIKIKGAGVNTWELFDISMEDLPVTAFQADSNNPYVDTSGTPFNSYTLGGYYVLFSTGQLAVIHDNTDNRIMTLSPITGTPTTFSILYPSTTIKNNMSGSKTHMFNIETGIIANKSENNIIFAFEDIILESNGTPENMINFQGSQLFLNKTFIDNSGTSPSNVINCVNSDNNRVFSIDSSFTGNSSNARKAIILKSGSCLLQNTYFRFFQGTIFAEKNAGEITMNNVVIQDDGGVNIGAIDISDSAVLNALHNSGKINEVRSSAIGLRISFGARNDTTNQRIIFKDNTEPCVVLNTKGILDLRNSTTGYEDGGGNTDVGIFIDGPHATVALNTSTNITGTNGDVIMSDGDIFDYTEITSDGPIFDISFNIVRR